MLEKKLKKELKNRLDKHNTRTTFESVWENAYKEKQGVKRGRGMRRKLFIVYAALIMGLGCVIGAGHTLLRQDDITYEYIDDDAVKGTWKVAGFVEEVKDFKPEDKARYEEEFLYMRGLIFEEEGTLTSVSQMIGSEDLNYYTQGETWTKGHIISEQDKTNSKYWIEELDGKEYLFMEWKSGDYTYRSLEDPLLYVFERGEIELSTAEIRVDDMSYTYITDKDIIGEWKVCDIVEEVEDFDPHKKAYANNNIPLKELEFLEGGELVQGYQMDNDIRYMSGGGVNWTRGAIVNPHYGTRSHYQIHEIDEKEYLFLELKSADYTHNKIEKAPYYVFERVEYK